MTAIQTSLLLLQLVLLSGALKTCDERVPDSANCAQYGQDSCTMPERAALCQRYCGICEDVDDGEKTNPTVNKVKPKACQDSSRLCFARRSHCKISSMVSSLCPQTCGLCASKPVATTERPTRAPTTTRMPTESQLIPCSKVVADSEMCALFEDSCTSPERRVYCQRYCKLCVDDSEPTSTTTVPPTTTTTTTAPPTTTTTTTVPPTTTTTTTVPPTTTVPTTTVPPTTTTTAPSTTKSRDTATDEIVENPRPVLIRRSKTSTSTETENKSCVDLTNFLCPMFKCMGQNSEFQKLCDKQTLYICDKQ